MSKQRKHPPFREARDGSQEGCIQTLVPPVAVVVALTLLRRWRR